MIITRKSLPRRTFLHGAGLAIGLPLLDAMSPALAAPAPQPIRLAWFYVPNGTDMRQWTPEQEGPLSMSLPAILRPLESLKNDVLVLSNLSTNWGPALPAEDHGRALVAYMTGGFQPATSADRIAASAVGSATRLPSLEVSLEEAGTMSWEAGAPLPALWDPRQLFERLFGSDIAESPEDHKKRLWMRRSILDLVMGDAKKLSATVGASDKRTLDEYLTSVREIERQIEQAGPAIDPGVEKPFGVPPEFPDYFRLMTDMMVAAFRADVTRFSTLLVGREGSIRAYPEIGITDGHHPLTHHRGNAQMLEKVRQINQHHVRLFGGFLEKMKETREGDSNLLDQSLIVYGSGLADGNAHTHDQLPILLAGRGGSFVSPGRHIVYERETPLWNLFASMLERAGVGLDQLGPTLQNLRG